MARHHNLRAVRALYPMASPPPTFETFETFDELLAAHAREEGVRCVRCWDGNYLDRADAAEGRCAACAEPPYDAECFADADTYEDDPAQAWPPPSPPSSDTESVTGSVASTVVLSDNDGPDDELDELDDGSGDYKRPEDRPGYPDDESPRRGAPRRGVPPLEPGNDDEAWPLLTPLAPSRVVWRAHRPPTPRVAPTDGSGDYKRPEDRPGYVAEDDSAEDDELPPLVESEDVESLAESGDECVENADEKRSEDCLGGNPAGTLPPALWLPPARPSRPSRTPPAPPRLLRATALDVSQFRSWSAECRFSRRARLPLPSPPRLVRANAVCLATPRARTS